MEKILHSSNVHNIMGLWSGHINSDLWGFSDKGGGDDTPKFSSTQTAFFIGPVIF